MEIINFSGRQVTRENVLQAMIRFDKEYRHSYKWWRSYAVENDGRLYPPKEIMSLATGIDVSDFHGGKTLNNRFRELIFHVVRINEEFDVEDVENEDAIDTSLSLESDLEKILVSDVQQLEPGLRLYQKNGVSGQQYDTKTVGRIDVLAIDQEGNLVVIELKAGEASDKVCGQILRYMGWVEENLSIQGNKVRGIIVANSFSERLIYATKMLPNVTLKRYEINFSFIDGGE